MCRFFVYRGHEMLMADLLMRSERSLIRQSYKAREWEEPLNGDGFGIGWYVPEIDPTPCVYTSVSPAWSNRNLHRLSEKIRSGCFFAHVRAATPGLPVNDLNCHPFQFGRLLWMHNGAIPGFTRLRRRLRESLSDRAYDMIQGSTDTEHAFAVFVDALLAGGAELGSLSADDMAAALGETLAKLRAWRQEAGIDAAAHYNFAITDGETILATRYVDDENAEPHTLYMLAGERFEYAGGGYRMLPGKGAPGALIVASEPLTASHADWSEVPPNHMVVSRPGGALEVRAMR